MERADVSRGGTPHLAFALRIRTFERLTNGDHEASQVHERVAKRRQMVARQASRALTRPATICRRFPTLGLPTSLQPASVLTAACLHSAQPDINANG